MPQYPNRASFDPSNDNLAERLGAEIRGQVVNAAREIAVDWYRESLQRAPKDTRSLRDSADWDVLVNNKSIKGIPNETVARNPIRKIEIEVTYNTPYAAAQELGHRTTKNGEKVFFKHYSTGGTGSGYLSDPLKERSAIYRARLQRAIVEGR